MKNSLLFFLLMTFLCASANGNHLYHKRPGTNDAPFVMPNPPRERSPLINRGKNYFLPTVITAAGVAVGAALAVKKDQTTELAVAGNLSFDFEFIVNDATVVDIDLQVISPEGSVLETVSLSAPPTDTDSSSTIANVSSGDIYRIRIESITVPTGAEELTVQALLNGLLYETQFAIPPTQGQELIFVVP